uniref:Uncharacterized protein n=1 Tax=Glossina brevipalpis TaxID=37001 RepID=A0A1A9WQ80_9MUSC
MELKPAYSNLILISPAKNVDILKLCVGDLISEGVISWFESLAINDYSTHPERLLELSNDENLEENVDNLCERNSVMRTTGHVSKLFESIDNLADHRKKLCISSVKITEAKKTMKGKVFMLIAILLNKFIAITINIKTIALLTLYNSLQRNILLRLEFCLKLSPLLCDAVWMNLELSALANSHNMHDSNSSSSWAII